MPKGFDSLREVWNPTADFLARNRDVVESIKQLELGKRSAESLLAFACWIKEQIATGDSPDDHLIASFALTKEAAKRVLGMSAFDCQLLAGIAIYEGKLAEMYTGEGKTLAGIFPATLHALAGRKVHIITFNDYLVERDARQMAPVFELLGISCGYITAETPQSIKRELYSRDVLYITMKECGFDYLRDFIATDTEELVQTPFEVAIIDEADSMLIDEARIPLVIAGDVPYSDTIPKRCNAIAKRLEVGTHFTVDEFAKKVSLTERGIPVCERMLGVSELFGEANMPTLDCLICALEAEYTLKKDKDYIVKDGKILIVDEFTGRVIESRHYPDGLQTAVELKEELPSRSAGMILSQITIQHFTRMYVHVAGMTGTAATSADEFMKMYGLGIVTIPTNRPNIRHDRPDSVYYSKDMKMRAVISETINLHNQGRPVLIGTMTVEESEWFAGELQKAGVFTQVLNAKHDVDEARIISRAGQLGAVTVATNMAGRGVDIKLGGEKGQSRNKIMELGGLFVIGTGHFESRRTDNQLRGRAGRQGDPGETHFFVSLEDELMVNFGLSKLLPRSVFGDRGSSQTISDKKALAEVLRVQRIAEGYYRDMRSQLAQYSSIVDDQRRTMHTHHYNLIIGAEQPRFLAQYNPEKALKLQKAFGPAGFDLMERQLVLHFLVRCWAEYLEYINAVRQGIHLVVIGGEVPIDEFRREAIKAFSEIFGKIKDSVVEAFENLVVSPDGIDFERSNLKRPTSTWTYLIDESADQFTRMPELFRRLLGKTDDETA